MRSIATKLTCAAIVVALIAATMTAAGAQSLDDLAARGTAIANADPLSAELRNRLPDDSSRRGFDIGMAAAEGNTEPGPGKQRIHDSLPQAEQGAFDAAVSFSLQRNRNAQLAATGAAIARADPVVAQARTADPDVFYWLGFDIASGLFGDPALGATGNTLMGPGSARIRDALNPAAQRGFNGSVAFHVSRNYRRPAGLDPSAQVTSAGKSAERTTAVLLAQVLPRVPNIVGMSELEARRALDQARLVGTFVYLDATDQSILYNHVGATVPVAGSSVADGKVQVQVPRPATRNGIGALSLSDFVRRDGFDLDEGRYEEIRRGADIVLQEDKTPIVNYGPDGQKYYTFKGLFVEPSDGAIFAFDSHQQLSADLFPGGLGAALNYDVCMRALQESRAAFVGLPRGDAYGRDVNFCVLTSQRQVAVVQFRNSDMACCGGTNFKFHVALFPLQVLPVRRARKP